MTTNTFSKKQLLFKLIFSLLLLVLLVIFYEAWQNWQTFFIFIFAYSLGIFLLLADEQYLYKFYEEKIDLKMNNASHNYPLASRNFLFLLVLPLLSIFVLTSSGSVFGIALILSINFYLLIEMWQLKDEPILFAERFLANAKLHVTKDLINKICYAASAYFVFLLIILLF